MKRSEMIKFLKEKGEERTDYAWVYIDPETVLDLVEEAGMLPPIIPEYNDDCFDVYNLSEVLKESTGENMPLHTNLGDENCVLIVKAMCKWEPEDK